LGEHFVAYTYINTFGIYDVILLLTFPYFKTH